MPVVAPMQFIGEIDGKKVYWAQPGDFTVPGVYFWDGKSNIHVSLTDAVAQERERCAMLHESVNLASDDERINKVPGAGAMGAVIEYRDLIRNSE